MADTSSKEASLAYCYPREQWNSTSTTATTTTTKTTITEAAGGKSVQVNKGKMLGAGDWEESEITVSKQD